MSYTIAVPASSIQKVLSYGIPSITSVSGGVAVANGAVSVTSSYPGLPQNDNVSAVNGTFTNTVTTNSLVANSVSTIGNVNDKLGNVRDFSVNIQNTSYTLTANDNAKLISTTSTVIIPTGVFTAGQTATIFNNSSSNITISSANGTTVYQASTSNVGNRTLAQRGIATIVCVASNIFVISGAGIS